MLPLISKYYKLNSTEKKMFFEAYVTSFYARMLLLFCSFKRLEKRLGKKSAQLMSNENQNKELLVLIKRSIIRASKYSFWRNKCFEQSLTAAIMLRKRKIHYVLYLGLAKKNNKLVAHVWMESQGYFLVNKGNTEFTTLSTFYA